LTIADSGPVAASRYAFFTSKERDSEAGLDYFKARYLSYFQGRFSSPDPTMLSANGTNPQTWNRYLYVVNNPLNSVDPLGLWRMVVEYEVYTEGKKKGQVKSTHVYFVKEANDNAASLLKQFGFKATDKGYGKLLKQIDSKVGSLDTEVNNKIDGSKLGGSIGDFFGIIESKLTLEKIHETNNPNARNGPRDPDYNDCSMTSCRLAFPGGMTQYGGIGTGGQNTNFGVDDADANLAWSQVSAAAPCGVG